MTGRSSDFMPRTSCGAPMTFEVNTVRRRLSRTIFTQPSTIGTPSVIGCRVICKRGRQATRRPAADLHGARRRQFRLVDRGRRGSSAGNLRMDHGSQYLCACRLHRPDDVLWRWSAMLGICCRSLQTNGRWSDSLVQAHAEGTGLRWDHGGIYRSYRGQLRDAGRRGTTANATGGQWIVEKQRLPEVPLIARHGVARRDLKAGDDA